MTNQWPSNINLQLINLPHPNSLGYATIGDIVLSVYPETRSHTGTKLSMGTVSIYSTSMKQKLDIKSSTEVDLVGVNEVILQVLWTQYFLEAQGYGVKDYMAYQDNLSNMTLTING